MKKKPKKGSKNTKPITKLEPTESFFNFFSPPKASPILAPLTTPLISRPRPTPPPLAPPASVAHQIKSV